MKTEICVIIMIYMCLKHSPDYIDSKYKWVHEINSLNSSVSAEIPFLAFFALHKERKRCSQVDPAHVTPRLMLYVHTKLICSSKDFSGRITYWVITCYHGNLFLKFLAYVLSGSKTIIMPSFREIHPQFWPE